MNMKLKLVITLVSLMMMTGLAIADPDPRNLPPLATSGIEPLVVSGAIINNGVIQLGVNELGNLNVPGGTPSMPSSSTTFVGLRYMPTNGEATAPGCFCEGWGAADAATGVTGYANKAVGTANLNLISFSNTTSEATSIVEVLNASRVPKLRVKHYYHPAAGTANLYQVDVEITNLGSTDVDLRYRRVMDWDIAPDTFNEYVTINKGSSPELVFTSDNGFASANPLSGPSSILATGSFVDSGPDDHGALFDFNFGTLAPGKTKSFTTFYGAAGNEHDADLALSAVGAEAYSYGQPNFDLSNGYGPETGTPHTFIFAFGKIGGGVIFPQCSNGIDDDKDGAIDFPADSDCSSADDPKEGPDTTIPVPEFPTIALPIVSILGLMFLVSRMKKN